MHVVEDSERLTPNELADLCETQIAKLSAEKAVSADPAEKKQLSARIRSCRTLLLFARTRARYVPKANRA